MPEDELISLSKASQAQSWELLSGLIKWAVSEEKASAFIERLASLQSQEISTLNAAIGVVSLRRSLDIWSANSDNDDEEFWQQHFAENSFILEQVFQFPMVIMKSKAYVGGKNVMNVGGNIVDFLLKNTITHSPALVEIKTPKTRLLGSVYRENHPPSQDLSGTIVQVLNYRNSLLREQSKLLEGTASDIKPLSPICVVVIGNAGTELDNDKKRGDFELTRTQSRDVQIITYDELFERVKRLISILEGESQPPDDWIDDDWTDIEPF
jgi:hypothetical protein